jgi:hypothetical protein
VFHIAGALSQEVMWLLVFEAVRGLEGVRNAERVLLRLPMILCLRDFFTDGIYNLPAFSEGGEYGDVGT